MHLERGHPFPWTPSPLQPRSWLTDQGKMINPYRGGGAGIIWLHYIYTPVRIVIFDRKKVSGIFEKLWFVLKTIEFHRKNHFLFIMLIVKNITFDKKVINYTSFQGFIGVKWNVCVSFCVFWNILNV